MRDENRIKIYRAVKRIEVAKMNDEPWVRGVDIDEFEKICKKLPPEIVSKLSADELAELGVFIANKCLLEYWRGVGDGFVHGGGETRYALAV